MDIAFRHRSELDDIEGQTFDVVVVGGGIIGASTAREAAAAGYKVLLVEKDDFATGATSRSSRLLHCGLRYFETPNPIRTFALHPSRLLDALRMAKQAMMCRYEFVKTAPERVTPIEMMFPVYKNGHYLPWQVDLGFAILSRMAPKDVPLNYRRLDRDAALAHPMCANLANKDHLHSVAIFTEYQFLWPERICVDAVLDAENLGAVALNYTLAKVQDTEGDLRSVRLERADGTFADVKARRVAVMAGLWIDRVLKKASPDAPRKSFGTKGSHIVVKLPDALRGVGVATINSQEEPFYCIPQGDLHYIGPTETVYDGDPDHIACDTDDLTFLIEETANLFPGFEITKNDVIRTWAGVRPLTYDENQPKGKRARELHDLTKDGMPGVFAMTAGPIMTHRDAGREVVRTLRQQIEPSRTAQPLSYTPHLPVENSNTARIVQANDAYHLEDVHNAVRQEHAQSLFDVLYRRTEIGWHHTFEPDELDRVADVMADELGWSPEQRAAEVTNFQNETQHLFGVPGRAAVNGHRVKIQNQKGETR